MLTVLYLAISVWLLLLFFSVCQLAGDERYYASATTPNLDICTKPEMAGRKRKTCLLREQMEIPRHLDRGQVPGEVAAKGRHSAESSEEGIIDSRHHSRERARPFGQKFKKVLQTNA